MALDRAVSSKRRGSRNWCKASALRAALRRCMLDIQFV